MKKKIIKSHTISNANTSSTQSAIIVVLQQLAWTLSNICRGSPCPSNNVVKLIVPAISNLLQVDDEQVLSDSCWTFAYICGGNSLKNTNIILEMGDIPKLVEMLNHQKLVVQIPSLRALGNICTGSDKQTQVVINAGILEKLKYIIKTGKEQENKLKFQLKLQMKNNHNKNNGNNDNDNNDNNCSNDDGDDNDDNDDDNDDDSDDYKCCQFCGNKYVSDIKNINKYKKKSKAALRRQVGWTLSNITSGNCNQIQAVIDSKLFDLLLDELKERVDEFLKFEMGDIDESTILISFSDDTIRKEFTWAVANACICGNENQVNYILKKNGFRIFCGLVLLSLKNEKNFKRAKRKRTSNQKKKENNEDIDDDNDNENDNENENENENDKTEKK